MFHSCCYGNNFTSKSFRNCTSCVFYDHSSSCLGQKKKLHSVFPVGEGEAAPAWVAFDRKVLNFSGYFQENVNITKNDEQFRIRKVKVYFYLEDDSVQVNEPQIENSGIPQGMYISILTQ